MIFTPTNDGLSERAAWQNSYYNDLIDDLQAKTVVAGDFTYPLDLTGSVGFNGSSLYNVGNFGSDTSSNANAIRIPNGLGFKPGGMASDNATSFQAIIDGLSTRGSIMLGPGIYDIDATIQMNGSSDGIGNYTLAGQGVDATVIRAASGFSGERMIQMTTSGGSASATAITIRDLTIDCNSIANLGLDANSCTRCRFINVRVTGSDSTALNGDGVLITNCDQCFFDKVESDTNDGAGFRMNDTNGLNTDTTLDACLAYTNTGNGFHFESAGLDTCSMGCIAYGNAVGFHLEAVTANETNMVSYTSCRSRDNTSHGFSVNVASGDEETQSVVYTGCQSYSNGASGFDIRSLQDALYFSFSGCASYNNEEHGLFVSGALYWSISGGHYSNNDQGATDTDGIHVAATTSVYSTIIGAACSSFNATQESGIELDSGVTHLVAAANAATGNSGDDFDDNTASATNFVTQDAADAVSNKPAFA